MRANVQKLRLVKVGSEKMVGSRGLGIPMPERTDAQLVQLNMGDDGGGSTRNFVHISDKLLMGVVRTHPKHAALRRLDYVPPVIIK